MGRTIRRAEAAECRRCSTYCDRVIAPATCVAARCAFLYAYEDPLSGRRFMGCMHKVFATEIDVALFEAAERTRGGFGSVKLAREPLRRCAFTVEQAVERGFGAAYHCTNRRFFDYPDSAPDALRAFDLREGLSAA
ncbi:MAG TPA: hypothetical protein VH418_15955 [Solirubrobacteraceae bacterium]|jgi:hypothetical protein